MTRNTRIAILPGMNPLWPTWLKISYAIACIVTTAAVLLAFAVFAVRPLTEWFGEQTSGWPAWANLLFVIGGIAALYSLGFYLKRRDQKADRSIR